MIRTGLAAFALLALTACMTDKPPLAFTNQPIDVAKSQTDIETAIVRSLEDRGWMVTEKTPGRVVAKIDVRARHSATIAISYTATTYSIAYVDSSGLDYDAKKGTIHRNYNRWIANLNNDIAART